MAQKYINLSKSAPGTGTQEDPYSPEALTTYLAV